MTPKKRFLENSVVDETDSEEFTIPEKRKKESKSNNDYDSSKSIFSSLKKEELEEFIKIVINFNNRNNTEDSKKKLLSYKITVSRFQWDKIKFKNFSPSQCHDLWEAIQAHTRKFRTFEEISNDALEWCRTSYSRMKFVNHPTKPPSAYQLFFKEQFHMLKEKDPSISVVNCTKPISESYRNLSPKKKEHYNKKAQELNDEFKHKMSKFAEEDPDTYAELQTKSAESNLRHNKKPSQPRTPFKIYCDEKLSPGSSSDGTELKEEFDHLDEKTKFDYIQKAKLEYVSKLTEFEEHNAYLPTSKKLIVKKNVSPDLEKIYFKYAGIPVKPSASSGYMLFSHQHSSSDELQTLAFGKRSKVIAEKWKSLPDEEKTEYNNRAKKLNDDYKLQREEFNKSLSEWSRTDQELFKLYNIVPTVIPRKIKEEYCEEEREQEDFPKSVLAFYKLKTNNKKSDWKGLDEKSKEKWRKKYEKKKSKHEANLQNGDTTFNGDVTQNYTEDNNHHTEDIDSDIINSFLSNSE